MGTAELRPTDPLLPDAEAIIVAAVNSGIRIFDTASNYGDGTAEVVLGNVTKELRDRVLILTKAGQKTEQETLEDGGSASANGLQHWSFDAHSIQASVMRSQKRLQRDYIDCVFLHNPEDILLGSKELLPALIPAIDYLEKLSSEGAIGCWGISSWSGFFSKDQKIAPIQLDAINNYLLGHERKHHFMAIQFPFGVWNLDAIKQKSQYSKTNRSFETLFRIANNLGISCLVNAPFNGGNNPPISGLNGTYPTPAQQELVYIHHLAPLATRVIGMTSLRSIGEINYLREHIHNGR